MSHLELPTNLVEAAGGADDAALVARGWAAVPRRTWVTGLPRLVDDLARRWCLEVGRPFQPGGVASWVAPARRRSGESVVLKLGWRHDEAEHEPHGLREWNGKGTVRLFDAVVDDETTALLLERCHPGGALSQMLPPQTQDETVSGLLRRLWIEPPPGHPFRPLQTMCDRWAEAYEQKDVGSLSGPRLDPGVARAGIGLFRSLPGTADRCVVLFTDLHPDNVLAAEREPWLAIDPKPYVGDPTYDPLQHMLNFPDRLAADPVGFCRRMAHLLDLHPARLRQWLFARCVVESADRPRLVPTIMKLAP
ncbi:MAG: aminoglycoside phosphotransferase family protein [Acidimicrobiales bacterium]